MASTYVLNVAINLVGLQLVNVPMFFCLRRLVAPLVILYELLALGKVPSGGVAGSIAVIVLGSIVAGWETLGADFVGYAITLTNNFVTAINTVLVRISHEWLPPRDHPVHGCRPRMGCCVSARARYALVAATYCPKGICS